MLSSLSADLLDVLAEAGGPQRTSYKNNGEYDEVFEEGVVCRIVRPAYGVAALGDRGAARVQTCDINGPA
jgi:hypothetical protein